jgi:hypothetical protein
MRRISLSVLVLIILSVLPSQARNRINSGQSQPRTASEQEVLRDFEKILDLWRDGNYSDLFERTSGGKESMQQFAKRLASAPRKPACCWEKMQDVRVSLKSDRAAVVRARLGFEGSVSGTEFVTKSIKLAKEDGLWIISQSDLFTIANLSKRRARYKYLPIQKQ